MTYRRALKTLLVLISFQLVAPGSYLSAESIDRLRVALGEGPAAAEIAAPKIIALGPTACRNALESLVATLRYDEESVFAAVTPAILEAGPDAVAPLEHSLNDSNFFVRRRAAQLLGRIGKAARHAAPALASLTLDPNADVHGAASEALVQIGEASVPAIEALLGRSAEQYRKPLITLLGRLGPTASPILLERLRRDESPYIRTAAAEALVQPTPATPADVKGLLGALKDLDEGVRAAAAGSLGELGLPAQSAIGALLVAAYEDRDSLVRQKAQQSAARLAPLTAAGVPGLLVAFRSSNPGSRRDAANLLVGAQMTFVEASPLLGIAMKDADPLVRAKAVEAAGVLSKEGAEALPLLRAALEDSQPEVRSAAIRSLGGLKSSSHEAAMELTIVLKDPNPALRREAVEALTNLGSDGLQGLLLALKDPYDAIAGEAIKGLAALGEPAVPELEKLAASGDTASKPRAAEALRRLRKSRRR